MSEAQVWSQMLWAVALPNMNSGITQWTILCVNYASLDLVTNNLWWLNLGQTFPNNKTQSFLKIPEK